ncbi:calmodulin-binding receptor-like cytoplasmic kinase 3 [Juglans microcarpa x Juglans regia]|uniref:calmodulin-binding receptor-like cytoplasmic kinase 3 n=1 Tax=Juglans microcarpa x Juglans regia TaxID=2249226 RepID=UPI001B7EBC6D|nr:calmodulin-binding receptor-like cytoplasmic kinase 3 [Juglans microcarpa x Juglans regia]XP_041003222.1 calmodulin-binding receptor-like cytoplasmic kinase 3 [Juglans microcarpa x Juglans regia]
MDLIVLSLLLLMQLPRIYASEIFHSKVCGADHIDYSYSNACELFYINGNAVDKVFFCKALQSYRADGCIFDGYLGSNRCDSDPALADLEFKIGRKLSQKEEGQENRYQNNHPNGHKRLTPKIAGMATTGVLVLCCVSLCACFQRKRKATSHTVLSKEPHSMDSVSSSDVICTSEKIPASPRRVPVSPSPSKFSLSPKLTRLGSLHLTLSQVTKATGNFSPSLQIGEGGFGTVYRAQLEDGQVVAIKRAKKEVFESLRTEFSSEVDLLAKIDHRSLVKLLGYIDRGNERLIITEYVPNGTLREHLDGQRGKILDFNQRIEIAIDVAHGLTYLHQYAEKQIIHRDVKSSNILLTESMRAKVADFGFARLGPLESDQTHISTKVKGTVGYLDPEYMRTYQLTTKSDVYSFGILLIEILTGHRPVDMKRAPEERVTLRWAFNKYNEGNVVELVDPLMEEVVDSEVLMKMFSLAFHCAAPIRDDRPDMKSVGEQLWAIRADYLKSARRGH